MGIRIEICCCSGGMALGFRQAGIGFDLAFDKDPDACSSYEKNLGVRPVQIDVRDLLRLLRHGFELEDVDLIVADPPCTPWSTAGTMKGLEDERDCLAAVVEIVKIVRPRAFLLGNVPGLQHEHNLESRQDTIGSLSYLGYCCDETVLDSAEFGVPQHRVRPFWFLHRGSRCITWPLPTHGPASSQTMLPGTELLPFVTCRVALGDLPLSELGRMRQLKPTPPSEHNGGHPFSKIDEPAHTICARADGSVGGGNVLEWPWDRPATTVDTTCAISQPGKTGRAGKRYQSANAIVLSERARLRLQGFPDGWVLVGKTSGSRSSQLGQAMPPPLAAAIGKSVVQWLSEVGEIRRSG